MLNSLRSANNHSGITGFFALLSTSNSAIAHVREQSSNPNTQGLDHGFSLAVWLVKPSMREETEIKRRAVPRKSKFAKA
jgi:hypothetical protein